MCRDSFLDGVKGRMVIGGEELRVRQRKQVAQGLEYRFLFLFILSWVKLRQHQALGPVRVYFCRTAQGRECEQLKAPPLRAMV